MSVVLKCQFRPLFENYVYCVIHTWNSTFYYWH